MTRLAKLLAMVMALSLAGCVVHRVESTESLDGKAESLGDHLATDAEVGLVLTPLNTYPEGAHCFEPLFYVLSLGVIPTHCVSRLHVSEEPVDETDVSTLDTDIIVTSMQGWLPTFLGILPDWQLGYGDRVEDDVRELIEKQGNPADE